MWSEGLRCHWDLVTFPGLWAARGSCSWVRLRSGLGPALSFYLLCIYIWLLWVLLDSASSFSRVEFWSHFPLGFPHLWQQEESFCLSFFLPVPGNPCTQASVATRDSFSHSSSSCSPSRAVSCVIFSNFTNLFLKNHILELVERRDPIVFHLN